jgi:hypothetical protein
MLQMSTVGIQFDFDLTEFFEYGDGKRRVRRPRTRKEQFSSPAVVRAMEEADRLGAELRAWRKSRLGKKVSNPK